MSEDNFLTASDMRKKAINSLYTKITMLINEQAAKGNFSMWYKFEGSEDAAIDDIKAKLKVANFGFGFDCDNRLRMNISW